MKTFWDIAGAGLIAGVIVLGAAYAAPLVQRASAMSETKVEAPRLSYVPVMGVAREIPATRRDVRRVGPRFYPDPANALDLRGEG